MLLNRVANVSADGVLTSSISSVRGRFIAALNQLLSGRLCLSSKGVGRAKQALTIAVRYAATRLCVGESGESDTPILEYGLQQRAIIPLIARTYAVSVVGMTLVKVWSFSVFACHACSFSFFDDKPNNARRTALLGRLVATAPKAWELFRQRLRYCARALRHSTPGTWNVSCQCAVNDAVGKVCLPFIRFPKQNSPNTVFKKSL